MVVLAVSVLATGVGAENLRDHRGKWHPWTGKEEIPAERRGSALHKAAIAQIERIREVFTRAKPLDPPVGVNVRLSRGYRLENSPASYYVLMILKDLYRECPSCPVKEHAEGPHMLVSVNSFGPLIPQSTWQREYIKSVSVFPQPALAAEKELAGFPVYRDDFSYKWVVIARRGRPAVWKPVSNERALTLLIQGWQAKLDQQRKRGPSQAEELRLTFESKQLEEIKHDFAAMAGEDRARQAWSGCKFDAVIRHAYLCRGAPPPDRWIGYVEPNEDYWDATLPAAQPQLIMLHVLMVEDRRRQWRHALGKPIVEGLDWKALGEIVNSKH